MLELGQVVMQNYLETLDDQLNSEVPATHRVINRQARTINFSFGPVTFKRRYYQVKKAPNEFFLDRWLALAPRSRQSPYLVKMMVKFGQATTMRNTAMALNMLFDSGISHSAVMEAVHTLGAEVIKQTQAAEKTAPAAGRRVPECLMIEGDAFIVKQKHEKKTRPIEVHHYRVYEREQGNDGKFKVVRCHDFLEIENRKKLAERVRNYLDLNYELQGQTVYLASDAGPGYAPQNLLDLLPGYTHGEYFLDRYHCLRKIENTSGRQNVLTPRALTAVRINDFDELMAVLDTFEGNASKDQEEEVKRLRAYFTRNWAYVTSPKQRGYEIANIGSIKSSHRAYTYRMKKQGKAWTIKGAKAMLSLIEARKKDQLEEALENSLKQLIKAPELSEEATSTVTIKVRDFLKVTPPRPFQGTINGFIPLDALASSPIGRMIKALSH